MSQAFDAGVKVAFSMTPEGHKFDEEMARARERAGAEEIEISQKYKGLGSTKTKGEYLKALRGFQPHPEVMQGLRSPRHQAVIAALRWKKKDKRN